LKDWNREIFGNILCRKGRTLARIGGVHKATNGTCNQFLMSLEKQLIQEYDEVLGQEEMQYWYQKSRCKWIFHIDKKHSLFPHQDNY
jgi:hypothetical protein